MFQYQSLLLASHPCNYLRTHIHLTTTTTTTTSLPPNPLHLGPNLLPPLHNLRTNNTILRITQRPHNPALGLLAHQRAQRLDQEPRKNVHAPRIRHQRQHARDIEPAAKPLEQLARLRDALAHVLDGQELVQQRREQCGLLGARRHLGRGHGRRAGRRGPEDGAVAVQAVRDGGAVVAQAVREEAQGILVAFLAAVEYDHLRDQGVRVRLQAREDGGHVVGGGAGGVVAEEVEEAEAGLPPVCWDGVVGDEGVVGWFWGLEDAVGFVGLGEGFARGGVGFEFIYDCVEVECYEFVDVLGVLCFWLDGTCSWMGGLGSIPFSRRRGTLDTL